jgi:hypothetical protein
MNTGNIQGIFAGMVILMIVIIFIICVLGELTNFNTDSRRYLAFAVAFLGCIGFTIGLKSAVLEGDRNLNEKDVIDIIINGTISGLAVIGTMVLYISQRPLISRAFENTVGYKWISWFSGLSGVINNVFTGPHGQDYSIIATQLFDDQFTDSPDNNISLLKNVASMFSGVNVKNKDNSSIDDLKNSIDNLKKLITTKHQVSEATLISLAAIIAFYISYLPVWKPWIRG